MRSPVMALAVLCLAVGLQSAWAGDTEKQTEQEARREQLRIAVQAICPVSGEELGSMGDPIKVFVGEAKEEVFLCCQGCVGKQIDPKLWATIHQNIAAAQGKCPIMKNDLPKKSKWTVVDGQLVYVCCPPCIKKVEADPDAALAEIDAYYTSYLEKKAQGAKPGSTR